MWFLEATSWKFFEQIPRINTAKLALHERNVWRKVCTFFGKNSVQTSIYLFFVSKGDSGRFTFFVADS